MAVKDLDIDLAELGLKDILLDSPPSDFLCEELAKALKDPEAYKDKDYAITDCLNVFRRIKDRQIIEALLLNGKTCADIMALTECSENFILTYSSVFYDISVFLNEFDRTLYLNAGTSGIDAEMKKSVKLQGEEYFKLKSGVSSGKLSVDDILLEGFFIAYSQMMSQAKVDDLNNQEVAQGWANTTIKYAQMLKKGTKGPSDIQDFVIKFKSSGSGFKGLADLK